MLTEIPEVVADKTKTKHDKEINSARNHKKITDTFHLEFNTGDFTGITVPHKVYNELQVEAHKSKFDGIRVKDRRDISTHVSLSLGASDFSFYNHQLVDICTLLSIFLFSAGLCRSV